MVDERLNWEEQFKTVKGKVHGYLTTLKKLKNILPQSQLSNVYRALVESHMRYADVIWSSLSNARKESLHSLGQSHTRDSAEILRFQQCIGFFYL